MRMCRARCLAAVLVGWGMLAGSSTTFGDPGISAPAAHRQDPTVSGQLALDEAIFPGLVHPISLDLRGMDVIEVLKFLAAQGQLNIVTSPEVQGRVTLVLTDVTVRDALDIVLVSNSLAVERRGTILYVMSGQVYEQLYGLRYSDPRQGLTVTLRYANANQVGTLLGNIKSPVGRIVIDEPTATLAILDTPGVLTQMQTLIALVDIPTIERQLPTETKVLPLHFAKAEDVQPQIESVLTKEIGVARIDKRSNALIVTDMPARMPQIEALVGAFDTRTRQVFIESTILQVTLRDEFDTGIEWDWVSESLRFPDVTVSNKRSIGDVTNPVSLVVGTLGANDFKATLKALHHFGDTKVLSSPHIAVMNGEDAKILVGRRQPYATSTSLTSTSSAEVAETIQFIEVGVKLYVTPIINDTGFITLKIRPEVSSKVGDYTTSKGNVIPIVETAEAETRVVVKDGTTVIIGGLMKDTLTFTKSKVPLLGDLPVLGVLFRNRSDQIKKEELVILLTPHAVTGEEFFGPAAATASVDWPAATRIR